MEFDPNGTLVDYRIARTVIKSAKRFTYKEKQPLRDTAAHDKAMQAFKNKTS